MDQRDDIGLTDMAKARTDSARTADVIKNWLRNCTTLEVEGIKRSGKNQRNFIMIGDMLSLFSMSKRR